EAQQVVGQVLMSPKTVGAFTDISRRLLAQSSIDVEAFVRNDLAQVLAIAMDLAALHGTGASNQPTGVALTAGIGAVFAGGAANNGVNANGIAPVWADVVNLETAVAVANADVGRLGYITNPKVRGKLKQTQMAANLPFIWQGKELNGYPTFVSSQVRSDITKGSNTTLSAMFFGNWADLIIGMWGALDVLVDPYTGGTSGTVRIVELQDVDIAVRHPASFALCQDMLA
ncbi:MAG: phage major capsid protein, partial [Vicinamibacteria bacterium]